MRRDRAISERCRWEGVAAFHAGKSLEDNPYEHDRYNYSDELHYWRDGFMTAKREAEIPRIRPKSAEDALRLREEHEKK